MHNNAVHYNCIAFRCFGIVHKMQDSPGYMCLLFAEIDAHQPVSNVVAYVKRLISLAK